MLVLQPRHELFQLRLIVEWRRRCELEVGRLRRVLIYMLLRQIVRGVHGVPPGPLISSTAVHALVANELRARLDAACSNTLRNRLELLLVAVAVERITTRATLFVHIMSSVIRRGVQWSGSHACHGPSHFRLLIM